MQLVPRDTALRVGGQLLTKLGIPKSQARDIQKVPVEKVMAAYFAVMADAPEVDQMTEGFSPTMDGKIVAQHPFTPTAATVSADVPVMIGSTRTEMTLTYQNDAAAFTLNEAGMRQRLTTVDPSKLIEVYRKANPSASPSDLFFLIASDYRYGAPTMKIAERRAALRKGPVYLYYFAWETPVLGGRLKSPHTIEIPFAFDNVKAAERLTGGGPEAMALADRVSDTWIKFARTGDPNNSKIPKWAPFNAQDRATMVFNTQSKVVNDPIREQRIAMFEAMKLT
jgi:para-nitrobenzyl esterase